MKTLLQLLVVFATVQLTRSYFNSYLHSIKKRQTVSNRIRNRCTSCCFVNIKPKGIRFCTERSCSKYCKLYTRLKKRKHAEHWQNLTLSTSQPMAVNRRRCGCRCFYECQRRESFPVGTSQYLNSCSYCFRPGPGPVTPPLMNVTTPRSTTKQQTTTTSSTTTTAPSTIKTTLTTTTITPSTITTTTTQPSTITTTTTQPSTITTTTMQPSTTKTTPSSTTTTSLSTRSTTVTTPSTTTTTQSSTTTTMMPSTSSQADSVPGGCTFTSGLRPDQFRNIGNPCSGDDCSIEQRCECSSQNEMRYDISAKKCQNRYSLAVTVKNPDETRTCHVADVEDLAMLNCSQGVLSISNVEVIDSFLTTLIGVVDVTCAILDPEGSFGYVCPTNGVN